MMKKAFFVFLILFMEVTASAFGSVENSAEILDDVYAEPSRYICYGGASTGLSFLIDRESIRVDKYEPPTYIIAFRAITHHNNGQGGENIENDKVLRYAYNYRTRKIYVEMTDKNGIMSWKEIDPAKSKTYRDDNWVAAGEIAFYLAYNMSFYDKPIIAKAFINEGRSKLPLVELPNGGDSTIHHIYNHRTHVIEWWKHQKNPRTGKDELIRVR